MCIRAHVNVKKFNKTKKKFVLLSEQWHELPVDTCILFSLKLSLRIIKKIEFR